MNRAYAIAYRLGITPWERAGEAGKQQLASLLETEEQERAVPYGKALDLGCGRGSHSIDLARRGWEVTAVDVVPKAIQDAKKRAAERGVAVDFVVADVTALSASDVGKGFTFFLDVGCFHGLTDSQRLAMAESVTNVATADATMLLLAFQPGKRGPLPRGTSRSEIERSFDRWTVLDEGAAETAGIPRPLKKASPRWYRLRRT
jgi:SAM-dependent methyltransferase